MVVARTVEGEVGVLPGHAPLLAVLAEGVVRVTPMSGEPLTATLGGGFVSVEHDRVTIVSDGVVVAEATAR
jgi:F-type H+-transporting ATPase subunit epsilon